jgi:hypothetical protein
MRAVKRVAINVGGTSGKGGNDPAYQKKLGLYRARPR